MRKQAILVLVISFTAIVQLFSQDIANSIKNYEMSKSDIISRGRNLLLDSYVSGNVEKVNEAYLYLNNKVADQDYKAFNSFEQIYLGTLTKNYNFSIAEILYIDSVSTLNNSNRKTTAILPNSDQLSQKLAENAFIYLPNIYKGIEQSTLKGEEKDMLKLILNDIFENHNQMGDDKINAQKNINKQCDVFLATYPNSKYEHYVRNYIRLIVGRSNWGLGMDFSFGYADAGARKDYINNGFAMGIGWDTHYKKFALYTRINILGAKTNKDFYFGQNAVLPAGAHTTYAFPELSLGYEILNNRTITLIPFAGLGGLFCSPAEDDIDNNPALKGNEMSAFCTEVGINCDIKFRSSRLNPYISNEYSYNGIRLRLAYLMPNSKRPELNGNQIMITAGWTFVGFSKKRTI